MATFNPKPKPEPKPRKTPKKIVSKMPIHPKPKGERRTLPQSPHIAYEHILDDLCSKYVIMRDKRCVTCGTQSGLTCSHYVDRRYMLIRWDDDNCNCQCANCNQKHDSFRQPYRQFLIEKVGESRVDWLESEGKSVYKWSELDLLDMIAGFKFKIKEMK